MFHHEVSIEMDSPDVHAVSMQFSNNNGESYSDPRAGVFDERRLWKRLGQSRLGRIYEFSGSTNAKLTQGYIRVNYGAD